MISPLIPPLTLNFLRWILAFFILLPLAAHVLHRNSALWTNWRRFSVLGLVSVGCYNALQYLALHTSTPINVTLVAASTPVMMLVIGRLFYGASINARQLMGAALSIAGVLIVLGRGDPSWLLEIKLVVGDIYILLASVAWAFYSWMLTSPNDPPQIRNDWAAFLMAQIVYGLGWSGLFALGEWTLTDVHIQWSGWLVAALLFVAVGPALLAYRCWAAGIGRAGPSIASFFSNLTPLFTALLSATLLGETPHLYHALAFVLIVAGIVVTSRR
jgi:drug/metabolite transporter (DMT)-like permease